MPGRDELRGDDAADIPGAAGDEHSHDIALSFWTPRSWGAARPPYPLAPLARLP